MRRQLLEFEKKKTTFTWEETSLSPFDELIVSWNAKRPQKSLSQEGSYRIEVSLLHFDWSPWLNYAVWSALNQYTFKQFLPESFIQTDQDTISVLGGKKAHGFKIRILAENGASLENFEALYACKTNQDTHFIDKTAPKQAFINLDISPISQMTLADDRRVRLCSPTSTTAVLHFLLQSASLSPLSFADAIVDSKFDIYGNWALNTAGAYHELGNPWKCFACRLTSFDSIIDRLKKGYPVVASIKGPLKQGALPYETGHLLVVKGYDSEKQEVLCIDPAFPTKEAANAKYPLDDFLNAWERRKGLVYIFEK